MYALRRSAFRAALSTTTRVQTRSRTFVSLQSLTLRSKPVTASSYLQQQQQQQRRWASDEVQEKDAESSLSESIPEAVEQPAAEVESASEESSSSSSQGSESSATSTLESAASEITESVSEKATEATEAVKEAVSNVTEPGNAKQEATAHEDALTVYVGNLFFDVTQQDLKEKFESIDGFVAVNLVMDEFERSRGFAYLKFKTEEQAKAAIEAFNGKLYAGRQMVLASRKKRKSPFPGGQSSNRMGPSKSLYIGNMSFQMTDDDLSHMFKGFENLVEVRVAVDRRTSQPRGFAHVDFMDVESAEKAKAQLAKLAPYGRPLFVDYATSRSRASRPDPQSPQQAN